MSKQTKTELFIEGAKKILRTATGLEIGVVIIPAIVGEDGIDGVVRNVDKAAAIEMLNLALAILKDPKTPD